MNYDALAVIISICALLFSVVSPLMTEYLKGKTRLKERKQEIEYEKQKQRYEFFIKHRAEVIENFLGTAGKAIEGCRPQYFTEFGNSCFEIYLYLDEKYWKDIDKIIKTIDEQKYEEASKLLIEFSKEISNENIRTIY